MALSVVVLGVDSESEGRNGIENGLRQSLRTGGFGKRLSRRNAVAGFSGGERFGELFQTLVNFFKSFRAGGEKAFQRDAEIGFEDVFLPLFGFARIKVIGGGNSIATLVLGQIHGGVGDLNELLRRGTVQRIAGDAEAG